MRSRLLPNWRMLRAASLSVSRPTKARSTSRRKARPSSVGIRRPALRVNSVSPVDVSSCAISRLTFGCDVYSSVAAAVIEPERITAWNALISLNFMPGSWEGGD